MPGKTNDPVLTADLIRVLKVVGPLEAELQVPDAVVPVVVMGSVRPLQQVVTTPTFDASNHFTEDFGTGFINAPAGHIWADTGELANGAYLVQWQFTGSGTSVASAVTVQHRNAANDANIAQWVYPFQVGGGSNWRQFGFRFTYGFGQAERLRIINNLNPLGAGCNSSGFIDAVRVS